MGDIADLHFAPTVANRANLEREDIKEGVFITGNTVIDALKTTVVKVFHFSTDLLNHLDYGEKVILVTCHRRENYGEPMAHIMTALRPCGGLLRCGLVYPVHPPVVREAAAKYLSGHPRIHLIDPLDVQEMHNLMAKSLSGNDRLRRTQEEARTEPSPCWCCGGRPSGRSHHRRHGQAGRHRGGDGHQMAAELCATRVRMRPWHAVNPMEMGLPAAALWTPSNGNLACADRPEEFQAQEMPTGRGPAVPAPVGDNREEKGSMEGKSRNILVIPHHTGFICGWRCSPASAWICSRRPRRPSPSPASGGEPARRRNTGR